LVVIDVYHKKQGRSIVRSQTSAKAALNALSQTHLTALVGLNILTTDYLAVVKNSFKNSCIHIMIRITTKI